MYKITIPVGENTLLKARRVVASKTARDVTELVAEFNQHFVAAKDIETPYSFERFSLTDSAVRTVIQSNTTGV